MIKQEILNTERTNYISSPNSIRQIKRIYDFMDNFALFKVEEKTADNSRVFYTTGIRIFKKNVKNIAFKQYAADDIVPDNFATGVEMDKTKIVITCGAVTYRLTAKARKQDIKKCKLDKFSLDDFMNWNMVDINKLRTEGQNTIYLPINRIKIGELSQKQETALKMLLDTKLDGAQVKYQCCRVPAFSITFDGADYTINAHIYNFAEDTYLNSIEIYNSQEDFDNVKPYADFAEQALIYMNSL